MLVVVTPAAAVAILTVEPVALPIVVNEFAPVLIAVVAPAALPKMLLAPPLIWALPEPAWLSDRIVKRCRSVDHKGSRTER